MTPSAQPTAELSILPKADGSATFSYHGYTVTAAVNGPIEAQRRDENPFEAILDINVRPAAGVGGTADRQLESILQQALRQLIPIRNFPRSMIQITLQVTQTPENAYTNTKIVQAQLNLTIIPALLHASILSLLNATIPLKGIATAVTLAIPSHTEANNSIIADPDMRQADNASSLHVVSFTPSGDLLLAESEGSFTTDEWNKVLEAGQRICCQSMSQAINAPGSSGESMDGVEQESTSIQDFIRSVMETKTAQDLHWK